MDEWMFHHSSYKEGDCRIWIRGKSSKGGYTYGYVQWRGRTTLAHRVAFLLAHGRWPNGVVHHSCHNTLCVNPDHLQEMSRSEHSSLHNRETKREMHS